MEPGGQRRARRSGAKGRTAQEQLTTAQRRVQQARETGATELGLHDLSKLRELPHDIAGLTALQSLDLMGTEVSDLAPIAGLTALESLYLSGTQVSDLAPIAGLTALQNLYLRYTQVSDLAPIAHLTALQNLYLRDTKVSDLAPIAGLTALQILYLSRTQVSDLAPIARLTALQSLDLMGTQVSDLAPIARLTALQSLDLRETQVSDLAPIAGLTALQNLYLRDTQVSDLAPIARLTALQSLDLRETQVNDLAPIAGLTGLQDAVTSQNAFTRGEGLSYAQTPAAQKAPFDQLARLAEPALTVETINEVRRRQGLPAHIPEDYERRAELPTAGSLEPLPGIPSAFGFKISSGRITLASSPADWPVFPLPTSERDHKSRLDVSRTLAKDLAGDLASGRFNARSDYADSLGKYAQRLPKRPGDGNILLADAEARTLRNMFEADVEILSVGLASKLKTMLEQHIGLRVYYPEIEHFYRDVQRGRIEAPLPLDAVHGFVRGVREHTPGVFEHSVSDAFADSVERGPEIAAPAVAAPSSGDPAQPKPPPDPLGEIDPRKAHDFTVAGAVNGLWKVFREGDKVDKALKGWKKAGETLQPHVRQVLEWLRNFSGPGNGPPPMPPGITA